jgi:D-sedoheptulose 7-phosphate isomerase
MSAFLDHYFERARILLAAIDLAKVQTAIEWFAEARDQDRQIFVFGNGGSSTAASHLATEILKGGSFGRQRRFRIMALNESVASVTAYANDEGYETVFVEQLKNFARPGDLVVGMSSSGNSENVLRAIEYANSIGCRTIGMTGFDGGRLGPMVHLNLHVNEPHTGRSEDVHLVMLHMISYYFMEQE